MICESSDPEAASFPDEGRGGKRRNKIALNSLKTNDPAKSGRFASNNFKDLQSGRRNLFLRLAKDLAVFA
jgi:hypothetical protein